MSKVRANLLNEVISEIYIFFAEFKSFVINPYLRPEFAYTFSDLLEFW